MRAVDEVATLAMAGFFLSDQPHMPYQARVTDAPYKTVSARAMKSELA